MKPLEGEEQCLERRPFKSHLVVLRLPSEGVLGDRTLQFELALRESSTHPKLLVVVSKLLVNWHKVLPKNWKQQACKVDESLSKNMFHQLGAKQSKVFQIRTTHKCCPASCHPKHHVKL